VVELLAYIRVVRGHGLSLVTPVLSHSDSGSRNPSLPTPKGWPLSWVKDSITFPQAKLNELRGVDATLYVRFLRGTRESYSVYLIRIR
jgi:hypothetical protein